MPGFKSSSSVVDKGEGVERNEVGEVDRAQIIEDLMCLLGVALRVRPGPLF